MAETFLLDGRAIPFVPGDTVLVAALAAGSYIPNLCWDPDLAPHNSCRLCTVLADGRHAPACALPARAGLRVDSETGPLRRLRRLLLQMLFIDGNHICPVCEKSGDCRLQACAYREGMQDSDFAPRYSHRRRDDSHPEVLLDLDRCILCELCVRASRDLDGKGVFAVVERGRQRRLAVHSPTGLLGDSALAAGDRAVAICPVGAILVKGRGFDVPIGERTFDREGIEAVDVRRMRERSARHA